MANKLESVDDFVKLANAFRSEASTWKEFVVADFGYCSFCGCVKEYQTLSETQIRCCSCLNDFWVRTTSPVAFQRIGHFYTQAVDIPRDEPWLNKHISELLYTGTKEFQKKFFLHKLSNEINSRQNVLQTLLKALEDLLNS